MYSKHRNVLLKAKAVEYKGNKCEVCGYSKCIAALEFHHVDPKTKDKRFSAWRKMAWKEVQAELDKCVLLCSNCHKEHHFGETKLDEALAYAANRGKTRDKSELWRKCAVCGADFRNVYKKVKCCGVACGLKYRVKTPWPDDLLVRLETVPAKTVAAELGVAVRTVHKKAKALRDAFSDRRTGGSTP